MSRTIVTIEIRYKNDTEPSAEDLKREIDSAIERGLFTPSGTEIVKASAVEVCVGHKLSDYEFLNGDCLEYPDCDGTIRRRDEWGNREETRCIDDENWHDWAKLFEVTESDFAGDEDE